jgi:hypothetical protein
VIPLDVEMTDTKLPSNIQEFNEITAVIFSQLYPTFPVGQNIDVDIVAKALGLTDRQQPLPSGRPFNEVFVSTLNWLIQEQFVRNLGHLAVDRVVLTAKAITVMNVVPSRLTEPLGSQIAHAANDTSSARGKTYIAQVMGDFFGAAAGSFSKSISGG